MALSSGVRDMQTSNFKHRLVATTLLAGFAASFATQAFADDEIVITGKNTANASFDALAAAPAPQQTTTTGSSAPPASDQERREEEVTVTGTRLRTQALDGYLPSVTVTAEQIEARGYTNVIEALEELPFVGPGSNAGGANTQIGDNFAFTDLLNCGTQRTLTLVNGQRFISGNQGTVFVPDNATGAQVDLTVINPALIEQFDAVTGTGGATYGADAVCGVVNITLKDDYDGQEFTLQGGLTEFGDGGNWRASGAFGRNLLGGRLNVTVAGDYFHQSGITTGPRRPFTDADGFITNPLNGGTRNPALFSAAEALTLLTNGGAVPPGFLPAGSDNVLNAIFAENLRAPFLSEGGLVVTQAAFTGVGAVGGAGNSFFPFLPIAGTVSRPQGDPQGFSTFAPTSLPPGVTAASVLTASGLTTAQIATLTAAQQTALAVQILQRTRLTPFEFGQTLTGAAANPLAFVAQFSPSGGFPTAPNTNAATSDLFPRVAVPLQFAPNGDLVPFNIGDIRPPNFSSIGTAIGGDGFSNEILGFANILSETDRGTFNFSARYDVTDNIRYRTEFLFSELRFRSVGGTQTNSVNGPSGTAGNFATPIFIDQNPLLSPQALATLNALSAPGTGFTFPTIGGQRVFFLSRAQTDLTQGPTDSGNNVRYFRTSHTLDGDLTFLNRELFWEVAFGYGRSRSVNLAEQFLDIEFAIAADVVAGPNGQPVCRQQTLAAPESITGRNPALAGINIATPGGLVPTAEQVANCVPLNLFGSGNVSPEAIDFVVEDAGSRNVNQQFFGNALIGGDLFDLPAGPLGFTSQFEWRRESLDFEPSVAFLTGAARNTTGNPSQGAVRFFEGGTELVAPIFGGDFKFPGLHRLTLQGTVRVVSRSASTSNIGFGDPGSTLDVTFNAGGQWAPFEGFTFRGQRSRAVRSASIVELVGAPQTAFTQATANPCSTTLINQGPAPATRMANCIAAVQLLGFAGSDAEATTFLSTFANIAGARSAAVVGNPNLQNEQADNWNVGLTIEPKFIPGLQLDGNFLSINLADQISLAGGATFADPCFDSTEFPFQVVGGVIACDQAVFGTQVTPGAPFTIPAINALTGNLVPGAALLEGSLAVVQSAFQTAFVNFNNLNLGLTQIRAVNGVARYRFDLDDVFGDIAANWGSINLTGNVYYLRRFDVFSDGTNPATLNPNAGDVNPEFETRVDFNYTLGKFTGTLFWFRDSSTVGNVQTDPANFDEQGPTFVFPAINSFNLSLGYRFTDNLTARFIVTDLTAATPFPQFQTRLDEVGRTFTLSIVGRW